MLTNHDKLNNVVELVKSRLEDPNIDIDFCIPEVLFSNKEYDSWDNPYIIVKYLFSEHTTPLIKITLTKKYLNYPTSKISELVLDSIDEFVEDLFESYYDKVPS